jgi:uncharacterized protein
MENRKEFTRRKFVKSSAAVVTGSFVVRPGLVGGTSQGGDADGVPHRPLGKTGALVSCLGVGGYHLGSITEEKDSTELVTRALDAGINFFDNCWEYHDGVSEERLGAALKGRRDKAFVMTKVCTHGRGKDVAMKQLEESLRRLQTDHVDLWQIHEVVYWNDPELIFAPNGRLRRCWLRSNRARCALWDLRATKIRRFI